MQTQTQPVLHWRAPSKITHARSDQWYTISGVIAGTLIMYGIIIHAWTLSFTVGLLAGLYAITRDEAHPDHEISISEIGVTFDNKLYVWGDLKEFWILKGPTFYELHIQPEGIGAKEIMILTGEVDPFIVRDALGAHITQNGRKRERILDNIIRICKL